MPFEFALSTLFLPLFSEKRGQKVGRNYLRYSSRARPVSPLIASAHCSDTRRPCAAEDRGAMYESDWYQIADDLDITLPVLTDYATLRHELTA